MTKPYSPITDTANSEAVPKESIWSPQQLPPTVPQNSTFGRSTNWIQKSNLSGEFRFMAFWTVICSFGPAIKAFSRIRACLPAVEVTTSWSLHNNGCSFFFFIDYRLMYFFFLVMEKFLIQRLLLPFILNEQWCGDCFQDGGLREVLACTIGKDHS